MTDTGPSQTQFDRIDEWDGTEKTYRRLDADIEEEPDDTQIADNDS